MGGVPSTSADRNQVEDRSTAIEVAVSGLEFQGFGFGRVNGYYEVKVIHKFLGSLRARGASNLTLKAALKKRERS